MDVKLARELAQTVTGHVPEFAFEHGIAISDLPEEFCTIWPTVRPVLSTIAGVCVWIPGAGAAAGAVLGGLIKVGDQISAGICK